MNELYIIGNGFDLYHGMPTSYHDFREYLSENNKTLLESMSKCYNVYENYFWSQFEKYLGYPDLVDIEDEAMNYYTNIGNDDFRDRDWGAMNIYIQQQLESFGKAEIEESLSKWILSIKTKSIDRKMDINTDAKFLTFNYTDTLEQVYGITNVLHIHKDDKTLIFGHLITPREWENRRTPQMPEGLNSEEQELWKDEHNDKGEYAIDLAFSTLDDIFSSMYKNCSDIIKKHIVFFESLVDIEKITIIGHSLSDVDKPYFEKIAEIIDNNKVKWKIGYYDDGEKEHHKRFIESLKISNYDLFKFE